MNILIICASMRAKSQSLKVGNYLDGRLKGESVNSEVLELNELKLPVFDLGETEAPTAGKLTEKLQWADGYVFVSPEWNGMMSHGLVNMMQYVDRQMVNKPVMLVGVSSGTGGTYPIAQMRSVGHKNNHYVITPEALIVRDVNNTLNNENMSEETPDVSVKKRADYALLTLREYAKAMADVRAALEPLGDPFGQGV